MFYKDVEVEGFVANQTRAEVHNGQEWQVTRPYNMNKATIRGAELGYVQFFDVLPGWLSGFGVSAN